MATYSRAIAYAKLLGQRGVADLLTDSLIEERTAIESLTQHQGGVQDEPLSADDVRVSSSPALKQA